MDKDGDLVEVERQYCLEYIPNCLNPGKAYEPQKKKPAASKREIKIGSRELLQGQRVTVKTDKDEKEGVIAAWSPPHLYEVQYSDGYAMVERDNIKVIGKRIKEPLPFFAERYTWLAELARKYESYDDFVGYLRSQPPEGSTPTEIFAELTGKALGFKNLREVFNAAQEMKIQAIIKPQTLELTDAENKVLNILSDKPIHIDQIANETGLSLNQTASALLYFELKKMVKQSPGKLFSLKEKVIDVKPEAEAKKEEIVAPQWMNKLSDAQLKWLSHFQLDSGNPHSMSAWEERIWDLAERSQYNRDEMTDKVQEITEIPRELITLSVDFFINNHLLKTDVRGNLVQNAPIWYMSYNHFIRVAGNEYTAGERLGIPTHNRIPQEHGATPTDRIRKAVIRKSIEEGWPFPEETYKEFPDLDPRVPHLSLPKYTHIPSEKAQKMIEDSEILYRQFAEKRSAYDQARTKAEHTKQIEFITESKRLSGEMDIIAEKIAWFWNNIQHENIEIMDLETKATYFPSLWKVFKRFGKLEAGEGLKEKMISFSILQELPAAIEHYRMSQKIPVSPLLTEKELSNPPKIINLNNPPELKGYEFHFLKANISGGMPESYEVNSGIKFNIPGFSQTFIIHKGPGRANYMVVEMSTGMGVGKGDTIAGAKKAAEDVIIKNGTERFTDIVNAARKINDYPQIVSDLNKSELKLVPGIYLRKTGLVFDEWEVNEPPKLVLHGESRDRAKRGEHQYISRVTTYRHSRPGQVQQYDYVIKSGKPIKLKGTNLELFMTREPLWDHVYYVTNEASTGLPLRQANKDKMKSIEITMRDIKEIEDRVMEARWITDYPHLKDAARQFEEKRLAKAAPPLKHPDLSGFPFISALRLGAFALIGK